MCGEGGDLWSREHLDFIRSPSQSGFYLLNPESNRNEPTSKMWEFRVFQDRMSLKTSFLVIICILINHFYGISGGKNYFMPTTHIKKPAQIPFWCSVWQPLFSTHTILVSVHWTANVPRVLVSLHSLPSQNLPFAEEKMKNEPKGLQEADLSRVLSTCTGPHAKGKGLSSSLSIHIIQAHLGMGQNEEGVANDPRALRGICRSATA